MPEHTRIAQYFAPLTAGEPGSFSLLDDAALLTPPPGEQLVITTDSVIENIHVLPGATPTQFAQKLLRRNLSDLAAMGALPWRYTLNLHTPAGLADSWFEQFTATLAAEQKHFNLTLIGGDSTSGPAGTPIHCTLTCFGLTNHAPLRRSGAQVGDDLYVSGTIGDAALGLKLLQQDPQHESPLIARYHCPEPRLTLGLSLRSIATAAIDISDGLLADIAQLCRASTVGAQIARDSIPCSAALQAHLHQDATLWNTVLAGGDDYELCFTAPTTARAQIDALAQSLDLSLTRIGSITKGKTVSLTDSEEPALPLPKGYEHA